MHGDIVLISLPRQDPTREARSSILFRRKEESYGEAYFEGLSDSASWPSWHSNDFCVSSYQSG
jgi:hypothetical protein